MIEPVGHLEMLYAVRNAELVLTDSGGLQEETTVSRRALAITIRENTERPVTVDNWYEYDGRGQIRKRSGPLLLRSSRARGKRERFHPYGWKCRRRIADDFLIKTKVKRKSFNDKP